MASAQQTYVNVNPPQPTDPDKIEVLEFFSYGCPHCAVLDPMVTEWRKTLSSDVSFQHVPVAFNAGMKPAQQLYFALEAIGRDDLHAKVFEAIHQQGKRLFKEEDIVAWVENQGVDKAQFQAAMKSFGVDSKMKRADQLVEGYGIRGTPSIAVGGRFLTSPAEAGGYQETIDVANELLKMVPR
ncbi:thiol:disulfide interchange protein DsbA/DsbL [Orrella sp. 11846]|uniref:thiol:disulfide interchange protein DsbA/DsbL n=1 Tax=Orrella sp. 11846 TaxID=3409913 RepID=UPI003B59ACDE